MSSTPKRRIRPSNSTPHSTNDGMAVAARKTGRGTLTKSLTDLRTQILKSHLACRNALESAVEYALDAGRRLIAAQALIGHGGWTRWIEENFTAETGFSKRTAERYMLLARNLPRLIEDYRHEHAQSEGTSSPETSDDDILRRISLSHAYRVTSAVNSTCDSERVDITRKPRLHLDWLTPASFVERAHRLMGDISCDPCAAEGCDNVQATARYTEFTDGLGDHAAWGRRPFISPGAGPNTQLFVERSLSLFRQGELDEAILILPMQVDASWMCTLREFPRAFPMQSLPVNVVGHPKAVHLKFPLAIVFFGSNDRFSAFAEEFSPICHVYVPYGA